MNTDERRCLDSLTERVIGAILEVSNILGAGFLEKVYERALLRELGLRGIRVTTQASFTISYKGSGYWRILCRYPGRRRARCRTEMRGSPRQCTHSAMSQLLASLRSTRMPVSQFPETQSRVAAHRQQVSG